MVFSEGRVCGAVRQDKDGLQGISFSVVSKAGLLGGPSRSDSLAGREGGRGLAGSSAAEGVVCISVRSKERGRRGQGLKAV